MSSSNLRRSSKDNATVCRQVDAQLSEMRRLCEQLSSLHAKHTPPPAAADDDGSSPELRRDDGSARSAAGGVDERAKDPKPHRPTSGGRPAEQEAHTSNRDARRPPPHGSRHGGQAAHAAGRSGRGNVEAGRPRGASARTSVARKAAHGRQHEMVGEAANGDKPDAGLMQAKRLFLLQTRAGFGISRPLPILWS